MKTKIFLFLTIFFLITSCEKRERTNPFDSGFPKELWTPNNFTAIHEGTTVKLTWSQPITFISGYKITKKVGEESESFLSNQEKDSCQLTDNELTVGKLHVYTIVAYAGNNQSNTVTAQVTPTLLANLTTTAATVITANSAILGGTVRTDGGATITERGICWATTMGPTIASSKLAIGTGSGTFSSTITGLLPSTHYYFRAYAINSVGTAYGNEFAAETTGFNPDLIYGTLTDNEGNVYKTITIGAQTWMAENLKTTSYRNGDPIANVTDGTSWAGLDTGGYCWYNNNAYTYKATYGALYNWFAVADSRNIAPAGWHVPTDAEWTILTDYLGGESVAGGKLKEAGWTHWNPIIPGGTNSSGFTALPGGRRFSTGEFIFVGDFGDWWSSTEDSATGAWSKNMFYYYSYAIRRSNHKYYGFSVRCLQD